MLGKDNEPRALAIVDYLNVLFDAAVCVKQKCVCALTGFKVCQVLREHGVQPGEAIFS